MRWHWNQIGRWTARVALAQLRERTRLSNGDDATPEARYLFAMAATGSADSASATPSLQWPLVGRHEQLELFTATLADDRAHGFVVYGMAGVGKTRLADQCLAVASRSGRNVARATATEGSRSVPLGALAHLLPQS